MSDFIDALLRRMSLAEKVGQLNLLSPGGGDTTGAGGTAADIESRIRRGEVGFLPAGGGIEQLTRWQTIAVEQSPQKIPLIFTLDVIHGHRTVFPLPLALACSFDMELVRRTARVAATEAAAAGVSLAWAPMLDVSRDARWGRCAESPGEDPLLGAAFAEAMIEGYQQGDLARPDGVMACAKHFAGYGFAEGGRDYNAVDPSPYRMHNVVLPPFKAAVEAGVGAVMVGFHDLAGIPCTAHRELLRDLLRGQWGFDGLIVSDYTAIPELVNHGVAADAQGSGAARLQRRRRRRPGERMLLQASAGTGGGGPHCRGRDRRRLPPRAASQAAARPVRRPLSAASTKRAGKRSRSRPTAAAWRARRRRNPACCSRTTARCRSSAPAPSRWSGRSPTAAPICRAPGRWRRTRRTASRCWKACAPLAGDATILYAKGANIVDDPNIAARLNVFGETAAIDPRPPEELIAEAVAVARQADVVVACVGEAKEHSGESSTRTELGLPGSQPRLLRALHETGKPLVLVTMSGRPLALEWEDRHADAILHAWFGGSETGNCRRRHSVRRRQSFGQARHELPAQRRAMPDLLRRAADRPAARQDRPRRRRRRGARRRRRPRVPQIHHRLPAGRTAHAALSVRPRAFLQHVRLRRAHSRQDRAAGRRATRSPPA